jgi:ADP-ribosyl-[dinitrogen reductase] hydrolase
VAVEACALFAGLLVAAINGAPKGVLLLPPRAVGASPALAAIGRGAWRRKGRGAIRSSGYVVDTLEAALWCVYRATDFREAVLLAANLGDDADTVAAVTGQLAGAIWGEAGIPPAWRARLAWGAEIAALARVLFAAGRVDGGTEAPAAADRPAQAVNDGRSGSTRPGRPRIGLRPVRARSAPSRRRAPSRA